MRDDANEQQLQPIIIVRRGGGDHDDHHGGVWKIAFADFMTAMMAFFLVMWLINAANEETRVQVASYFNPVKLTDAVAGPKGVRSNEPFSETEEHDNQTGTGSSSKRGGGGNSGMADDAKERNQDQQTSAEAEDQLFKDPYAVLVEIAGNPASSQVAGALAVEAAEDGRPRSGEAFRDPFDPAFWRKPVDEILSELPTVAEENSAQAGTGTSREVTASQVAVSNGMQAAKDKEKAEATAPDRSGEAAEPAAKQEPVREEKIAAERNAIMEEKVVVEEKAVAEQAAAADGNAIADASDRRMAEAMELQKEITEATADLARGGRPSLIVETTDEGFLVSLTDDVGFGMFASASARPNADMVRYMDKVAEILAKRSGKLILRGHTDSRPFRSDAYDNWRLSTARAHMAYHMLVRGGLDAGRIVRIEGHADRSPKNPKDTTAAENRRIEILLVKDAT